MNIQFEDILRKIPNNSNRWKLGLSVIVIFSILINPGCTRDEEFAILTPDAGRSYLDIENEGYMVQLNAVPAKAGQLGTWRIYIGENGVFDDVHDPRTTFHGEPGESYQLGWEISDGNQYKAATITVSFKPLNPIIITAVNDTTYNNVSLKLQAAAAKFGATGNWEIVSGSNGRIVNHENEIAAFIGKEFSDYTVQWVLTYGSKTATAELSFTTDQLRAQAGMDRLDIKTPKEDLIKYATLDAQLPPGANGSWQIISGPTASVLNNENPHSLMKGVADSLYTLVWKVTLDEYSSADTVILRFRGKWGIWQDEQDGQTYRFTEINGLEWMAQNYNYAIDPGTNSWYYGHAYRSVTHDGYPLETEEDRKKYGRLYGFQAALNLAPEGWRLPTASEIESLINSQGGSLYAKEKLKTDGDSGLDLNYPGYFEFSSGNDPAFRNVFSKQELSGLYWTKDYNVATSFGYVVSISTNSEQIGLTVVSVPFYALSVRYVRDVQK